MSRRIEEAVGFASAASLWGRAVPGGHLPKIDPRLQSVLVPSLHQPTPKRDSVPVSRFHGHSTMPTCPLLEALQPGVLCSEDFGQRPDVPTRYGSKGLSPLGSRRIHEGLSLCEEERQCFAMWTIQLPDCAIDVMERLDTWWRFQTNLRHRLHRKLRARGLVPEIVGVVEISPKRSARMGKTIPHLHIVYRGKAHRWEKWRVSVEEFDRMVYQAMRAAGHDCRSQLRGGQVKVIKFSAKGYLRKYLSKPSRFGVFDVNLTTAIELIPRRWHMLSRCLLSRIKAATRPINPDFLTWLIDHREEQLEKGPYQAGRVPIEDPRAPPAWSVVFRSPEALILCLERWERAHGSWVGMGPMVVA